MVHTSSYTYVHHVSEQCSDVLSSSDRQFYTMAIMILIHGVQFCIVCAGDNQIPDLIDSAHHVWLSNGCKNIGSPMVSSWCVHKPLEKLPAH